MRLDRSGTASSSLGTVSRSVCMITGSHSPGPWGALSHARRTDVVAFPDQRCPARAAWAVSRGSGSQMRRCQSRARMSRVGEGLAAVLPPRSSRVRDGQAGAPDPLAADVLDVTTRVIGEKYGPTPSVLMAEVIRRPGRVSLRTCAVRARSSVSTS